MLLLRSLYGGTSERQCSAVVNSRHRSNFTSLSVGVFMVDHQGHSSIFLQAMCRLQEDLGD